MKKKGGFDPAPYFRALADRTRLRLINLIGDREVCVCFLVEILGANQPQISRHLAYLRRAGIVDARRDGRWMHYRIAAPSDPMAARLFAELRAWLDNDALMKADRRKLDGLCCGARAPVRLRLAPRPGPAAVAPGAF